MCFAASNLTYTISVTNFGPSTAGSVTVTDTLPVGASFVSASGGGCEERRRGDVESGNLVNGAVSNVTVDGHGSGQRCADERCHRGFADRRSRIRLNNVTPPVVTTVTPVADVAWQEWPGGRDVKHEFQLHDFRDEFWSVHCLGHFSDGYLAGGNCFVSAAPSATTNAIGQVIWSVGDLAAGATSNLALTVISTARGAVTNLASAEFADDGSINYEQCEPPVVTLSQTSRRWRTPTATPSRRIRRMPLPVLVNDQVRNPGGFLTLVSVSATNGVATVNGTNVVFTPALNFLGTLTLNYTIIDNVGGTNSSYVTVLVTNIPPVANPDNYAVRENSTNSFSPLVNDLVLTPGGTLQITGVSPTNGTASFTGTNVIFMPSAEFPRHGDHRLHDHRWHRRNEQFHHHRACHECSAAGKSGITPLGETPGRAR